MTIKEKLQIFYYHLFYNRGVGNTYTMLNGAKNNPFAKVIVPTMIVAKLMGLKPNQIISLDNLDALKGSSSPLAFDNSTLIRLFSDVLNEITRLEDENADLRERLSCYCSSVDKNYS